MSYIEDLRSVALQGYQFAQNGDRFQSGQIVMAYHPEIRHGEIIAVGDLAAYVDAVEHAFSVGPNKEITARTVVTFSRGLLGDVGRTYSDRGTTAAEPLDTGEEVTA